MPDLAAPPWTGALVAVIGLLLVLGLLWRYRALEHAGTPLPPGTGGARMVGTTGTVTTAHVPGRQRGIVHVLGDDWPVADDVDQPLDVGTPVRVEAVTGTRLVVRAIDAGDTSDVRTS